MGCVADDLLLCAPCISNCSNELEVWRRNGIDLQLLPGKPTSCQEELTGPGRTLSSVATDSKE